MDVGIGFMRNNRKKKIKSYIAHEIAESHDRLRREGGTAHKEKC